MRRREFIALLGSGVAAWPIAAQAQQSTRTRRIGVLMGLTESDPEGQSRIAAFRKTLQGLGWTEGRDLRTDYYWAGGDIDRTHALAKELVSSAPDVIVVNTPPGLSALRLETHTIPIIFVQVLDASESTGGPFARSNLNDSFLLLLAFIISISVPSLALSAEVATRKRHEVHLEFVMHELSHRSKNLLAVVQSMARQVARQAKNLKDFDAAFFT